MEAPRERIRIDLRVGGRWELTMVQPLSGQRPRSLTPAAGNHEHWYTPESTTTSGKSGSGDTSPVLTWNW
jgi:hypothetical protein